MTDKIELLSKRIDFLNNEATVSYFYKEKESITGDDNNDGDNVKIDNNKHTVEKVKGILSQFEYSDPTLSYTNVLGMNLYNTIRILTMI